jgi:hypothetical protein
VTAREIVRLVTSSDEAYSMSTTSQILTLVFCVFCFVDSLRAYIAYRSTGNMKDASEEPRYPDDGNIGEILRAPLRSTLVFWSLFLSGMLLTLVSGLVFLLSPTLTEAIVPSLVAALTMEIAAARWRSLTKRRKTAGPVKGAN